MKFHITSAEDRARREINRMAVQRLYGAGETVDDLLMTVTQALGVDLLRVAPIKEEDAGETVDGLLKMGFALPGTNPDPVDLLRQVNQSPAEEQGEAAYQALKKLLKIE